MIKVALFGAGKMGEAIAQKFAQSDLMSLVGYYEHPGSEIIGQMRHGLEVEPDTNVIEHNRADVFVDFTQPDASMLHFRWATELGKPIVVGTTGLSKNQLEEVRIGATRIPCLFAPNLSLGINLLYDLAAQAARALPPIYDIDIIEMHHRHKLDAPSGTALQLGRVIANERGKPPSIHAVRAGEIVGHHKLVFSGPGERIELTHEAFSRAAFAMGVVQAVKFLFGRAPGLYFVGDALGLR